MGILTKINSTGWLYSFGILVNKLIPAWLFRFRTTHILQLKTNQLPKANETSSGLKNEEVIEVAWCTADVERRKVEQVTMVDPEAWNIEAKACHASVNQKIVAGFWLAIDSFPEKEIGVHYQLKPYQCWLFSSRVLPAYRKRGIYRKILRFMVTQCKSQGQFHPLVAVNPYNKPSMAAHKKFVFRTAGKFTVLRILGLTFCFTSGGISSDRNVAFGNRKPISIEILSTDRPEA